jgi:replicative DNA helicase
MDFLPAEEPNNPELERAVLGSILIGGMRGCCLSEDDFYIIKNRWIYKAMQQINAAGREIDYVTITEELGPKMGEIGHDYIVGLDAPSSLHLDDYAGKLREYTIRRRIYNFSSVMVADVTNANPNINNYINQLNMIAGESVVDEQIPDAVDAACDFVQLMRSDKLSIPTGIDKLDQAVGGLELRKQTVLASGPGNGKTAMALQIAENIAKRNDGNSVVFFSLEMDKASLIARRVCGTENIMWRDVMAKRVSSSDLDRLEKGAMTYAGSLEDRFLVDDVERTTDMMYRIVYRKRPSVIVVDHLGLVGDAGENEYHRLGKITWNIKNISKEFNCAVLSLCQMNRYGQRQSQEDATREPQLSDLRDSGHIEQNADNVWFLFKPTTQSTDSTVLPTRIDLSILVKKFRSGPANIAVKLVYDLRKQWFESPTYVNVNVPYKPIPVPEWQTRKDYE